MKVDLRNQNFENIKKQNTSLVGANFVRCNLSGSQFENVDISGMNINGAILFKCKWRNMKINELNKLYGYSGDVNSIYFSLDGFTLASSNCRNLMPDFSNAYNTINRQKLYEILKVRQILQNDEIEFLEALGSNLYLKIFLLCLISIWMSFNMTLKISINEGLSLRKENSICEFTKVKYNFTRLMNIIQ